jgi:hypothetical protein
MTVPWWGWFLVALWCLPAVWGAFGLLFLQPEFRALDAQDEIPKPIPLSRKLLTFPLLTVVLVFLWPVMAWSEYRHAHH